MLKLLLGVALAIAITSTLDASGLTQFSALPLIPLFIAFALLDRLSRKEVGLTLGRTGDYALVLAHPILVIGGLGALAAATGAIELSHFNSTKVVANVALLTAVTFVMAIITEEGFFRGWLWGAAIKRGVSPLLTLVVTTVAFVAWHISFVYLSGEFHFSSGVVPFFFINATLIGMIWGLMRLKSGSILVSSAGHGLWNGLTYVLFGVGSGVGALGIRDVSLFGPEVGLIGIALNAAFAAFLLWNLRDRLYGGAMSNRPTAVSADEAPYHAHIYFLPEERETAAAVRAKFEQDPRILFVGQMTDGKAGPHPIPQFEIHFLRRSINGVLATIGASGHRALVHPLTDDDMADHTSLATWIGEPIDLDLSTLDPPGKNQGVPRFGKTDF